MLSGRQVGTLILLVAATASTGCRQSILHRDSAAHVAREAVVPITRSLDTQTDKIIEELKLAELTATIQLLTEDIRLLVNNSEETRGEITELIKSARELVSNVNSMVEDTKTDLTSTTTDSVWMKIVPSLIIVVGVLFAVLILVGFLKRK